LWDGVRSRYLPNSVFAVFDPAGAAAANSERKIPMLRGKTKVDGNAAAYICENYICRGPVTSPAALAEALS